VVIIAGIISAIFILNGNDILVDNNNKENITFEITPFNLKIRGDGMKGFSMEDALFEIVLYEGDRVGVGPTGVPIFSQYYFEPKPENEDIYKKFGILLIFSLIPFVGLNSVQTVLADHGSTPPDCPNDGEVWDPNSNQCVDAKLCPNGLYPPFVLQNFNGVAQHCALVPMTVGGDIIPLDTTMVLVAGSQNTAAWMIPVLVSAIGIGIVIARKF